MNSKGIKLVIQDQLERLRKEISAQEAQAKKLVDALVANRTLESKLSEMVKE